MKQRAEVVDIDDPKQIGRIRVKLEGFVPSANLSPWVLPCLPFAGAGYGIQFLPKPGDIVWIEKNIYGEYVYSGFTWEENRPSPTGNSPNLRKIRTPAGHELSFDDEGDVVVEHSNGIKIIITADGTIKLGTNAEEFILLGESFQQRFNDLVSAFNGHTHQHGSGPGMTAPTSQSAQPSDEADLSNKVKSE